MGSVFSKPKAPPPPPPIKIPEVKAPEVKPVTEMPAAPVADDQALTAAKKKQRQALSARSGRASTYLSSSDRLGG